MLIKQVRSEPNGSISELNKSDASSREIHYLNTRLRAQELKAREDKEMQTNIIKQLRDEKKEETVRHEAQINQLYNELKEQRNSFNEALQQIKSSYQERIAFLEETISKKNSDEPVVIRSRHFAFVKNFHNVYKSDAIDEQLLLDLDDQMEHMDELELRQVKSYVPKLEFWQYYIKFRVPQFAAYVNRIFEEDSRSKQRHDFVIATLTKYSEVYRQLGYPKFDAILISKAYRQAKENEQFISLKQTGSFELAAKVIKAVGKSISGVNGVKFRIDPKPQPKDLVDFDKLVECVMKIKKEGYQIEGLDQYSSRLFAFFLGFCIVTGQRNRTVREVKFEDFSKKKGKYYVLLFATKTNKQATYTIAEGIFKQVEAIKQARSWMHDELEITKGQLTDQQISKQHAIILREKMTMLQRRLDHVFPFYRSNAVHWHAARFRDYMIKNEIENAEQFTIHTVRAIALTQIAYNPELARSFGQHSSAWITTSCYVADPFKRDMIKGLDFNELIEPSEKDTHIEKLMKREKRDEEYEAMMNKRDKNIEDSD